MDFGLGSCEVPDIPRTMPVATKRCKLMGRCAIDTDMSIKRLLLLAGGQSEEHEISLISARAVAQAARDAGMACSVRVIGRTGRLLSDAHSAQALARGHAGDGDESLAALAHCLPHTDVIFPLLHGPLGEDGTMQGFLTLLGVPFVGSGCLASAVCMDKPMAKNVLLAKGIEQVDYLTFVRDDYKRDPGDVISQICERLSGPWFVKPANLGSSVGVSRATQREALACGIQQAFTFDRRIIVESGISGARELEVAILGNDQPKASVVGEITYSADFYDYATKYTEGVSQMHIPADIPAALTQQIQQIALKAYRLLDCAGLARCDFFFEPITGRLVLNEINTMPGFTPFSMFPGMWRASGLSYTALIAQLVELAIERHGATVRATGHART